MSDDAIPVRRPGGTGYLLLARLGVWLSVLMLYVPGYTIWWYSSYMTPQWYLWVLVVMAPGLMSASYQLIGHGWRGLRVGLLAYVVIILGAFAFAFLGYIQPVTKSELFSGLSTGVMAFLGLMVGSFVSAVGYAIWAARDLQRLATLRRD